MALMVLRRLRRDPVAVGSALALTAVAAFGLLAPVLAGLTGHAYHQTFPRTGLDAAGQPVPPGAAFWLGTDDLGRDLLVRAAYGARTSLLVGVTSTVLATAAGVAAGMVGGYLGGPVDLVLSRLLEIVLSFPYVLVAMAVAVTLGGGTVPTIVVIALFSGAAVARTVRGQVLSIRELAYVEAARALGAPTRWVLAREILPNLAAPVAVLASLLLPSAIVFEATLSYLGAGTDVSSPSWGAMLGAAQGYYRSAWWFLAVPAGLLLVTTLACNLLGDAFRDAVAGR
jgi:peptide/nickel transport system permease protein